MALRIIAEDETVPVSIEGTTFQVRVRPGRWFAELRIKHMADGEFDEQGFSDDVWAGTVVGWDRLENADGSEIPYSPEAASKAGRWMPDHVESKLARVARGRERREEQASGN
ncbi:hypothetical protein DRQ50_12010 [bacterium]|nr:MAG: hypothetical protein DRQ50_12010 [bacterium]